MSESLDCLLWCPDVQVEHGRHKQSHHLGILYVARVAQANGFRVGTVLHGHHVEPVAEEIARHKPRIVGVSVCNGHWRSNLQLAIRLCRRAKKLLPGVVTVLGGIVPTTFAREILASAPEVDIVVCGEGEYTFLEILQGRVLEGILGIAYRPDGQAIVQTPARPKLTELDPLPFALSLETDVTATTELGGLLGNLRHEPGHRSASIITSRGCNGRARSAPTGGSTRRCGRARWRTWCRRSAS